MQDEIDPSDADLVHSLSQLKPAAPQTSAQDLWYRAGFTAGKRESAIWKTTTAASLLALGMFSYLRPVSPPVVERFALVHQQEPATPLPRITEQAATRSFEDALLNGDSSAMRWHEEGDRPSAPTYRPLDSHFDGLPAPMLHMLNNTRG